ncbi:hypothetical protein DU502_12145 [Haloplanus aerogenes]|uniref:Uncharacterized protein n=1 Tax=Haloplanus aerogenes TaxID=660522 RepID=A0A3G8QUH4_9EURY|nr:hypothetical protein DU502_12145 [Haloplanus aerogenes]
MDFVCSADRLRSAVVEYRGAEAPIWTRTGGVFGAPYGRAECSGSRTPLTRGPVLGLHTHPPWRTGSGTRRSTVGACTSFPRYSGSEAKAHGFSRGTKPTTGEQTTGHDRPDIPTF